MGGPDGGLRMSEENPPPGKQKQIAISEFFEKNKHFLGFDSLQRSLITAVKEAVDNSLDACEEERILRVYREEPLSMYSGSSCSDLGFMRLGRLGASKELGSRAS